MFVLAKAPNGLWQLEQYRISHSPCIPGAWLYRPPPGSHFLLDHAGTQQYGFGAAKTLGPQSFKIPSTIIIFIMIISNSLGIVGLMQIICTRPPAQ